MASLIFRRDKTASRRFWSKVKIVSNGCWEWTGAKLTNGYGSFRFEGRSVLPHRLSYRLFIGEIPAELELDHLCRNCTCLNPNHLEAVTRRINVLRGIGPAAQNAAKTQCINGHPFDLLNTLIKRDGSRRCRRCHALREHARYHAGLRR